MHPRFGSNILTSERATADVRYGVLLERQTGECRPQCAGVRRCRRRLALIQSVAHSNRPSSSIEPDAVAALSYAAYANVTAHRGMAGCHGRPVLDNTECMRPGER